MEYLSVTQFCEKYGLYSGNVRKLIADGRIPADAKPPEDRRVKSGKYRNWRKKQEKSGEPD